MLLICCVTGSRVWRSTASSPPSTAYMRLWIGSTLVQIVVCCIFGTSPSSITVGLLQFGLLGTNFSEIAIKIQISIHENAFENIVCEKETILAMGTWIKVALVYSLYVWYTIAGNGQCDYPWWGKRDIFVMARMYEAVKHKIIPLYFMGDKHQSQSVA